MYDEYDEPFYDPLDDDADSIPRRRLSILLAVLTLGGFGWLAWFAYQEGTRVESLEDVPLILADTEPYRERPDEAGGMHIPHRDKKVYETLSRKPASVPKTAERVLPPPEEPITPPEPAEETLAESRKKIINPQPATARVEKIVGQKQQPKPAETLEALMDAMAAVKPYEDTENEKADEIPNSTNVPIVEARKAQPADIPITRNVMSETETREAAEPKVVPKPEVKSEPKTKPAPQKTEQATPKPEKIEPKPAAVTSGYRAQLGSYRSQEEVDRAWKKISDKHTALLSGRSQATQKADIPGKGTYFRLQVPVNSSEDGAKLCKNLSARKQGCLVVKQ